MISTKVDKNTGYEMPDIEDYDKLFHNENIESIDDFNGLKFDEIEPISKMYSLSKIAQNIANPFDFETILIYYLEKKNIKYDIISEYEVEKLKQFKDYIKL
jgi:hypothetical protein